MRGRTRPGRLRLLDAWLASHLAATRPKQPWNAIDVGLGDLPTTTVEFAAVVRSFGGRTIGVDADRARVVRAREAAPEIAFEQIADFELGQRAPVQLIRAMNVLRGVTEAEARGAVATLRRQLSSDGLLIEGSTDRDGALGAVHLIGSDASLLFFTDGSRGFAPRMFRDVLPRDLRRAVKPGTAIAKLLDDWQQAFEHTRATSTPPLDAFKASAARLPESGWVVASSPGFLRVAWPIPTMPDSCPSPNPAPDLASST